MLYDNRLLLSFRWFFLFLSLVLFYFFFYLAFFFFFSLLPKGAKEKIITLLHQKSEGKILIGSKRRISYRGRGRSARTPR